MDHKIVTNFIDALAREGVTGAMLRNFSDAESSRQERIISLLRKPSDCELRIMLLQHVTLATMPTYIFEVVLEEYLSVVHPLQRLIPAVTKVMTEFPTALLPEMYDFMHYKLLRDDKVTLLLAHLVNHEVSMQMNDRDRRVNTLIYLGSGCALPLKSMESYKLVQQLCDAQGFRDLNEFIVYTETDLYLLDEVGESTVEQVRRLMKVHGLSLYNDK